MGFRGSRVRIPASRPESPNKETDAVTCRARDGAVSKAERPGGGGGRMSCRIVPVFALAVLLAASAPPQTTGEEKPKAAAKGPIFREVTWSSELYQWKDISENVPNVKVVDLWGDRLQGAFSSLIKLPAGYALPLHVHTADLRIVVVSGALVHLSEGKPEIRLPSGSYLVEPAGLRHKTTCDPATDCVVFVDGNRKFDMNLVDEKKAPGNK